MSLQQDGPYLALVEKADAGCKITPMPNDEAKTRQELKTVIKARKAQVAESKKQLKRIVDEEKQAKRRFKRAKWAFVDVMTVHCFGRKETYPMTIELTDTWNSIKEHACELFEVNPDNYVICYFQEPKVNKSVKSKEKDVSIGEIDLFKGVSTSGLQ